MNFLNLFSGINLKEILQRLPDAVIVCDCGGRILWTNRVADYMFNIDHSEEIDLYFEDFVNNGIELMNKSSESRTPVIAGALTSDGEEFFIEMNVCLFEDRYIITVRDVTAMTKVLANAEKTGRLNKDKNVMLSKLTNEFKSPVQSIIGFSNALVDGLGGEISEKQDKYVKIIHKNASELLSFMDKFFEFSKAESSLTEFDIKPFNLISVVQDVIKSNINQASAKKLVINFDSENLTTNLVTTDEKVLKIILQNIIETSIKSTERGAISVTVSTPDADILIRAGMGVISEENLSSYLLLTVKDTGVGIQETELDGLFEPYTQLEKNIKKNFVRAIGLGTAKILANKLKGEIWAESEIMKGTTFNIVLPVERGLILEDE